MQTLPKQQLQLSNRFDKRSKSRKSMKETQEVVLDTQNLSSLTSELHLLTLAYNVLNTLVADQHLSMSVPSLKLLRLVHTQIHRKAILLQSELLKFTDTDLQPHLLNTVSLSDSYLSVLTLIINKGLTECGPEKPDSTSTGLP